jgi:hypothetical protein
MANQVTDQEIKSFVQKVVKALSFLKPEEIRELTENLEEAMLEKRSDEGEKFALPRPEHYANDLVEAAGLGQSSAEVSNFQKTLLTLTLNVGRYIVSFGPAWAIVRGYLIYAGIYGYMVYGGIREIPENFQDALVMVISITTSAWLNVKKFNVLKIPAIALNVLVLLFLVMPFGINIQNKVADYIYYAQTRNIENTILDSSGNLHQTACAYDEFGNRLNMETLTDPAGFTILKVPKFFYGLSCPSTKK